MARAYAHALGLAPQPVEIELLRAVKEFGVPAVFGSAVLSGRQVRDLMAARSATAMLQWYRDRQASSNWAEWNVQNPVQASLLEVVHEEYKTWQASR